MSDFHTMIDKLLDARKLNLDPTSLLNIRTEAEGGCGVIGIACDQKIAGRHLLQSLCQMRVRGNGKGGGIAAAGLSPKMFGVDQETLNRDYLLALAYLENQCKKELERDFIHSLFEIDHIHEMEHVKDYKSIKGLEVCPPDVTLYFVRVKEDVIKSYRNEHDLQHWSSEQIADEIVYQNSYRLNHKYYASTGDKRAFVLSQGKNLLVLKLVGYGEDVIEYYKLEDFQAHVWIGHHRYPTKGRIWHPGGAHPFVGLHEALVHNGDFANYYSICEYLAQRHIYPLFLTDTEVAALLFDLLHRTYNYPLEYVIEALAPTTERDFYLLPPEKQRIYALLQKTHLHASPDGPWFFLIAQSIALQNRNRTYRLLGITDTSMLRPQVFALQKGEVSIGFSASEKQAIDAALKSLSKEDGRFWSCADKYWSARGGSYTDGGAFAFTVMEDLDGKTTLSCTDKFGDTVHAETLKPSCRSSNFSFTPNKVEIPDLSFNKLLPWLKDRLRQCSYASANELLLSLTSTGKDDPSRTRIIHLLTSLYDQFYPLEFMRRSCLLSLIERIIDNHFESFKTLSSSLYAYLDYQSADKSSFQSGQQILIIDARGYPTEGDFSLAQKIVEMYKFGFKKMIIFRCQGQRFIANGLGPETDGVHIHVYGSSGDYLASGIDGAEVHVHSSAQDQLSQIMKAGLLVVHGDVGQAFMYGAKGGKAFIRGSAAGRPLINAVGKPRVVINGTCLDYLAESFMAGNPLKDGGFVIINGLGFDDQSEIVELASPYPGNNLFSLASGGAIYLRDPERKVTEAQLNGGEFTDLTEKDWKLILPYLEENCHYFNIPVDRLLEHHGKRLDYGQAYRKIRPAIGRFLQEEEAWVKCRD